jgi:CheY-like chemotaxis protein
LCADEQFNALLMLGTVIAATEASISIPQRRLTLSNYARSTRVLIVDDERVIADTLCSILNMNGYHAQAAYSGEQAVEAAKKVNPHILISDIIMGGMSGIEAAIQISASLPSCRVMLFSGHAEAVGMIHDLQAQGHHFELLTKPVHPRHLLDCLAALPLAMSA